jgi:hypothetical protein
MAQRAGQQGVQRLFKARLSLARQTALSNTAMGYVVS